MLYKSVILGMLWVEKVDNTYREYISVCLNIVEIISSTLPRIAWDIFDLVGTETGRFSLALFTTAYQRIKPRAREELLSDDPGVGHYGSPRLGACQILQYLIHHPATLTVIHAHHNYSILNLHFAGITIRGTDDNFDNRWIHVSRCNRKENI